MKPLYLIIIATFLSCTAPADRIPVTVDRLQRFFNACESDLSRARQVVVERNLITMLSHFQTMDGGGRKYYLLEREGITALIRSVTTGAYDDIILINREGIVVYTMTSDEIFASRISAGFTAALPMCLANRTTATYFSNVAPVVPGSNAYCLAVSAAVEDGSTLPGTIALIVGLDRLKGLVGGRASVLNEYGRYEIADDTSMIHTAYPDFHRIAWSDSEKNGLITPFDGAAPAYQRFRYRNVRWIIVAHETR